MNRSIRLLVLSLAALLLFGATGCNKLKARDQLNKGVQAYKNVRYEEAIEHFKNAVSYDPQLSVARLYLATAYAQMYIPGADTPDNMRNGQQAIDEFKHVLDAKPATEQQISSLKGIASLYYNMKKFDEAKNFQRQVAQLDPNDPEPLYWIGVIDWTQSYDARKNAKGKAGIDLNKPLDDKKLCDQLRQTDMPIVEEGRTSLDKAMQLRSDYDDAMAYMNLILREQADLTCGDPAQRKALLDKADDMQTKSLAVKRAKAEKAATPGGIVLEQNQAQGQTTGSGGGGASNDKSK
jgi:tetratricopeptide (TPR) repeat protein